MEIDCTGLDKIIKIINNLCKIIRNDLGRIGMKNSIFEKIKIDFYRNELVLNKNYNSIYFKINKVDLKWF